MRHQALKDILGDIFGFGGSKAAPQRMARIAPTATPFAQDWPSDPTTHFQADPLTGIYSHDQGGVASDIYGNPV